MKWNRNVLQPWWYRFLATSAIRKRNRIFSMNKSLLNFIYSILCMQIPCACSWCKHCKIEKMIIGIISQTTNLSYYHFHEDVFLLNQKIYITTNVDSSAFQTFIRIKMGDSFIIYWFLEFSNLKNRKRNIRNFLTKIERAYLINKRFRNS